MFGIGYEDPEGWMVEEFGSWGVRCWVGMVMCGRLLRKRLVWSLIWGIVKGCCKKNSRIYRRYSSGGKTFSNGWN